MRKIILIFILALSLTEIFAMSEEMQELIDNLHKTCVEETGTAEEYIINARNGDFSNNGNFKCYLKCLSDQMGCITDDEKIDIEASIAVLPPDIADKASPMIRKCGVEVGSDACDTTWLFHKCLYAENPSLYFLP